VGPTGKIPQAREEGGGPRRIGDITGGIIIVGTTIVMEIPQVTWADEGPTGKILPVPEEDGAPRRIDANYK